MSDRGPRLFNRDEQREQEIINRRKKRYQHHIKEVHRVRINRIVCGFAAIFIILGMQLGITKARTAHIKNEIAENKTVLNKAQKKNNKLKQQRDDLKDPDYVAKLIRYKYMYTENNEKVYNVNEKEN